MDDINRAFVSFGALSFASTSSVGTVFSVGFDSEAGSGGGVTPPAADDGVADLNTAESFLGAIDQKKCKLLSKANKKYRVALLYYKNSSLLVCVDLYRHVFKLLETFEHIFNSLFD